MNTDYTDAADRTARHAEPQMGPSSLLIPSWLRLRVAVLSWERCTVPQHLNLALSPVLGQLRSWRLPVLTRLLEDELCRR